MGLSGILAGVGGGGDSSQYRQVGANCNFYSLAPAWLGVCARVSRRRPGLRPKSRPRTAVLCKALRRPTAVAGLPSRPLLPTEEHKTLPTAGYESPPHSLAHPSQCRNHRERKEDRKGNHRPSVRQSIGTQCQGQGHIRPSEHIVTIPGASASLGPGGDTANRARTHATGECGARPVRLCKPFPSTPPFSVPCGTGHVRTRCSVPWRMSPRTAGPIVPARLVQSFETSLQPSLLKKKRKGVSGQTPTGHWHPSQPPTTTNTPQRTPDTPHPLPLPPGQSCASVCLTWQSVPDTRLPAYRPTDRPTDRATPHSPLT